VRESKDEFNTKSLLKGEILTVDEEYNFAIINRGKDDGLKVGDILMVYRKDELIGDVRITEVRERLSVIDTTTAVSIKKGDKIIKQKI